MPPKGKKVTAKTDSSTVFKEDTAPPTAVIIAEEFAHRFEPLTSSIPHCLLPLGNVPLIHFALSRVISDGFQQIIIFACRDVDKIRTFIDVNGYNKRLPGVTVSVFNGNGSRCMGDVMRDIEGNQLLHGVEEFVLIPADLVCDVNLNDLLIRFKEHKAEVSTCALGLVYANLSPFAFADAERLGLVYSMPDAKLIQMVRHDRDMPMNILSEVFSDAAKKKKRIEIRTRLADPRILLCSSYVPPLFQDNFDYDSMDDLIHGLLTNEEIMQYTIHLDFIDSDKVVLAVAPTLTHLLDMTPRILTRLGSSLIQPAHYLSTDAFSRLQEGLEHHPTTASPQPLAAISPSCYVSRSARIHPTARLIGACLIGANCHIGEKTVLINTCLGPDCEVGANSKLRNVVAVSNVQIGGQVVADKAWLCPQVRILDRVKLGARCFLGPPYDIPDCPPVGVTIGPDAIIPPESILVAPGQKDVLLREDECGAKGWAAIYQPTSKNRTFLSSDDGNIDDDSDSDLESGDELEVLLWRSGWAPKFIQRSRNASSRLFNEDGGSEGGSGITPGGTRTRLKSSGELEDGGVGGGESEEDEEASDDFLIQELTKTLQRSQHRQQSAEVVILEVNSLKHAYNISIDDLHFFLTKALLELAKSTSIILGSEAVKEYALNFKRLVNHFGDVLEKYLSSTGETGAQFCLQAVEDHACYHFHVLEAGQWIVHALYDRDLVSEATIRTWVTSSPLLADEDLAEGTAALRLKIAPFLKWLDEAEEEGEDSENEEE